MEICHLTREKVAAAVANVPGLRFEFSMPGDPPQEHWRVIGQYGVYFEYWPYSRNRTIFCRLTKQTHQHRPVEFFLSLIRNAPKWESRYTAKPKLSNLPCPICGKMMLLRKDGKFSHGKWFACSDFPACKGCHSAHKNGTPMGIPADPETRQWRRKTHSLFDQLWQTKKLSRKDAYAWLAQTLDLTREQCHIGSFDIETCKKAISALENRNQT